MYLTRICLMLIAYPPDNDGKLRSCLSFGYSRLEAADCKEVMAIENFHILSRLFVVNGSPQLHSLLGIGKPGRHDADDRVALCIKTYLLVQNRRVAAETPLPQRPAQNNGAIR